MISPVLNNQRVDKKVIDGHRALRKLARMHLIDFGRYMRPDLAIAPHQELVANKLEQVFEYMASKGKRGIGRLMIMMPPQYTKTTWASQFFPAWTLGRLPDSHFILTSYAADLAIESSQKVRDMIAGDRYTNIFGENSPIVDPVEIKSDSRSNASWKICLPYRGELMATGVGGGITGRTADCVIIDDPFKNRPEADSLKNQEDVMKWYGSAVFSRARNGTAIILFHTRWNPLDLAGRLLRASITDPEADQWEVLCLPAEAYEEEYYSKDIEEQRKKMMEGLFIPLADPLGRKPGEVLWPAEFPEEFVHKTKANLGAQGNILDWYALHQQQPRREEGELFSAPDFLIKERHELPAGLRWVRYNDLAISGKRQADFNCSIAMAVDKDANLWLRDRLYEKGWDNYKRVVKNSMLSDMEKGTEWGFENNSFQELALRELQNDRDLIGVIMRGVPATGDKVTRARPFSSRTKARKVFLIRGPWIESFISEAIDFREDCTHDDQIDTCSGGMEMLGQSRTVRMHSAVA